VGLLTTFVITFVYCWLFRRANGSVLLVMLFHVIQGTIVPGTFGYDGQDIDDMLTLSFYAWTIIAVALVVFDRAAWRPAPRAVGVRPATGVLTTPVVQP
jgi:hypothetical protein